MIKGGNHVAAAITVDSSTRSVNEDNNQSYRNYIWKSWDPPNRHLFAHNMPAWEELYTWYMILLQFGSISFAYSTVHSS